MDELDTKSKLTSEEFLMSMLCKIGEARSLIMNAIALARQGEIKEAEALLKQSDDALAEAHKSQTSLIGFDEGEGKINMTLILTHIQDHIMTTMLCRDLANEFLFIYKKIAN